LKNSCYNIIGRFFLEVCHELQNIRPKKKVTTDEVAINSLTREKFLDYGFSSKAYPKSKHWLHYTNDIFKGKKIVKKLK
jgi:protein-L-isoaspartate O-methyltransferase